MVGSKLAQYINKHISGNVYNDEAVLTAYATDRSILRIRPRLVALPSDVDDVHRLLGFANQLAERGFELPVAVRGSGLDKTGADLTTGMVISTERLTRIKALDIRTRLVHVEAGITLGALNDALRMRGLCLPIGADPRETIGGLIANAPTDAYAAKYGGIMNYVNQVEVALATGEKMIFSAASPANLKKLQHTAKKQAKIYRDIDHEITNHRKIVGHLEDSPDSVGYSGIAYVHRGDLTDLTPLLYGSQGTLAVVTEVILNLELLPSCSRHLAARFHNLAEAQPFLDELMSRQPERLDFYDARIFAHAEEQGKNLHHLAAEKGFVAVAEFSANSERKLKKLFSSLERSPRAKKITKLIIESAETSDLFKNIPAALTAYLNDGHDRSALLDGVYVPSKKFPAFIDALSGLEVSSGLELACFGSYSAETYNLRPALDLATSDGRKSAVLLLSDYANLVKTHGGSITGGTPEGRVKAMVTNHRLSDTEKALYKAIKAVFDPNSILNPDIKTAASTRSTVRSLRTERLLGENR